MATCTEPPFYLYVSCMGHAGLFEVPCTLTEVMACMQARLLLCHISRNVSEERIVAQAAAVGLVPCQEALPAVEAPFRLLCFVWR